MSQKLTLSIDNITISDEHIIANHFNKCFTSIAGKLLKKIWKSKKTFDSFLKKKKQHPTQRHSFCLLEEVPNILKGL